MRRLRLREFMDVPKVTRPKATVLPSAEASGRASRSIPPGTRPRLTRTAVLCCSQSGFREVMAPVPGDVVGGVW